jgi:AcrR family transcriptional regulator
MIVMNETTVTGAAGRRAITKDRIVRSAAALLAEGGREAVSTRSVAAAAGVQAPTIYRLFGDMQGLLDEAAAFGFSEYLRSKVAREIVDEDPVEDLRRGWDLHVGFGLDNPGFYRLMYTGHGPEPAAAREGAEMLRGLVRSIAEAGRLRVGVEHAAGMIHAAAMGVVLSLIAAEPGDRDPALSEATREAVLAAITTDGPGDETTEGDALERAANRAVALKAVLPGAEAGLTSGERALLSEWLDRIADPAR